MIKCPNCGRTDCLQLIDHDTYIWDNLISIYLTYQCQCGRGFVTRVSTDREKEALYLDET